MRLGLIVCLLLSACDDDNSSTAVHDLAVQDASPVDLTAAAGSCQAGINCVQQCTGANALACGAACDAMVDSASHPFFQALIECIQTKCTSLGGDAGTPACDDPQAATCSTCVQSKCVNEAIACFTH